MVWISGKHYCKLTKKIIYLHKHKFCDPQGACIVYTAAHDKWYFRAKDLDTNHSKYT